MMWNLVIAIIIGAISGWIAGKLMNSSGTILRDIILGIAGGFVGSLLFDLFGITFAGYLGTIVVSIIGACLLIFIGNKVFK